MGYHLFQSTHPCRVRLFKWGYAENVPLEIIEYGDPDGSGRDLKAYNEILLRAEAFIGWGILDTDAFARVEVQA